MVRKTLVINGVTRNLVLSEDETLAKVLREHLLLTGCKIGCGEGHCGACNVIMNGKVTKSCIVKMSKVPDNAEITTIEGVGTLSDMHPLQVAWMAHGCAQCGFCTPGFIISAKVLLEQNPNPTREEVRDWFNKTRNLCRCTGYKPLVDAVMDAAAVLRGEMTKEDLVFKPTGDSIAEDARLPASGPHSGKGFPRQHQVHRHIRSRKDARRCQGHHLQGHPGCRRLQQDQRPRHAAEAQQDRRL